jgi:hypothetical protein
MHTARAVMPCGGVVIAKRSGMSGEDFMAVVVVVG